MRLIHVSKVYHNKNSEVQALQNINLSFSNHGMTFIVGESGCGKTSLLNIIAGHDTDFTGAIEKDGRIESIEQDMMLMENLSIFDNLLLVSDDKVQINDLLEKFQLNEKDKKVKKLSVGEKKRVQIIRSFLMQASYLLCDEPTAALDYENGRIVMEMLKEISKEIGVIIVTHDIALVDTYQDRVIQMGKGCIIHEDPLILREHPITENKEARKPLKKQMKLLLKMMISRWQETLFQYGLLFMTVLVLFAAVFLFPSLNASRNAVSTWRNARNILVSEPNPGNNVYREQFAKDIFNTEESDKYLFYDLYNKEDIQLVKDNTDDVIGYRMGWNEKNIMLWMLEAPLLFLVLQLMI